jgi:hypothetical protein
LPGIVWMKPGYQIDYPMHRKLAKTLNGLNRLYDSLVHAAWDASQQRVMFWLVNGVGTTCNLRVDYYPYYDAFYVHTGTGTYMAVSGSMTISGVQNVYVSGYNPTYLFSQTGLTDNTTAITAYLETKREGNYNIMRNGHSVSVLTDLGGTETVTYSCYVDNASSVTRSVEKSTASGGVDTVHILDLRNRYLKHRIGDAATVTRSRIIGLSHCGQKDKAD